jgi:hypothetical protein
MRQATSTEQQKHLKALDRFIAELGGLDEGNQNEGPCSVLVEHLEAARRELLASMPVEYGLSLEQAMQAVGCVPDSRVRDEITQTLRGLLNSDVPA